jgi:hypothetical protein
VDDAFGVDLDYTVPEKSVCTEGFAEVDYRIPGNVLISALTRHIVGTGRNLDLTSSFVAFLTTSFGLSA